MVQGNMHTALARKTPLQRIQIRSRSKFTHYVMGSLTQKRKRSIAVCYLVLPSSNYGEGNTAAIYIFKFYQRLRRK